MWPYYPDLMAEPVPRYTSYPTALAFRGDLPAGSFASALEAIPSGAMVSLYLHIPYCEQICWYCGCNTGAANRQHRLAAYLDALRAEIAAIGRIIGKRVRVGRIAFGGGSPNAIAPGEFLALNSAIERHFVTASDLSISVELDPRALSQPWIEALAQIGVRRVSMGVQSFSPAIQARIGRVQPAELVAQAVADLRRAGIGAINFDLMYGLPGQTFDDLFQSIDTAIAMRPSRVALFGYAHHPAMFPRQRRIDVTALPDKVQRFVQAATGFEKLVAAGYQPIGFDHFALPGDDLAAAALEGRVRRNFQGFTEDASSYVIGLGASAISSFPDMIVQNEKNPGDYRKRIAAGELAGARGILRTPWDQWRGRVIERLLCLGTVQVDRKAAVRSLNDSLSAYQRQGLIRWHGDTLSITSSGRPYSQWIASHVDNLLEDDAEALAHARQALEPA